MVYLRKFCFLQYQVTLQPFAQPACPWHPVWSSVRLYSVSATESTQKAILAPLELPEWSYLVACRQWAALQVKLLRQGQK